MTMHPTETPTRVRIAATFGPEVIGAILVGLVAVGGLVVFLGSGTGGLPGPSSSAAAVIPTASAETPSPSELVTTGPTASPTPASTATVSPSSRPTASPTPTRALAPTPAPSSSPRAPAAWAAEAQTLVTADQRVLEWRELLRAEVASNPKRADDLARLIRSTNSSIHVALGALDALDTTSAPPDISAGLREAHLSAVDVAVATLAASLGDAKAYRTGAKEIVDDLDALDPLIRDLEAAAGIPDQIPEPLPSASASAAP